MRLRREVQSELGPELLLRMLKVRNPVAPGAGKRSVWSVRPLSAGADLGRETMRHKQEKRTHCQETKQVTEPDSEVTQSLEISNREF